MRTSTRDYLNSYQLSTTERRLAVDRVVERARAAGEAGLLALAEKAQRHDAETYRLEERWKQQLGREAQHGPRAVEIDQQLDRLLSGIKSILDGQALAEEDEALGLAATRMGRMLFPRGLGEITQASFAEQYYQIGRIKEALDADPQAAKDLRLLNLEGSMARLFRLWRDYGAEIQVAATPLSFDELRQARERGEDLLADLVVAILALCDVDEDPDFERRGLFLDPIERQNERMKQIYRGRGKRGANLDSGIEPEAGPDRAGSEETLGAA